MVPILENSSAERLEIVLEEWATQKEERPPLPSGVSLPSVLTENGVPNLLTESIDAVFFLDTPVIRQIKICGKYRKKNLCYTSRKRTKNIC